MGKAIVRIPIKKRSKYNNTRTTIDNIVFASKREAAHYQLLKLRERAGEISNLELQVRYHLDVNGVHITNYVCDFRFIENGKTVIQDVKGMMTRIYKMKRSLMKAIHGVEVVEVF
jgi:hypothetical protein